MKTQKTLPSDISKKLFSLKIENGRYVLLHSETFEYFQDKSLTGGIEKAVKQFGFHNTNVYDLNEKDLMYRVHLPRRYNREI